MTAGCLKTSLGLNLENAKSLLRDCPWWNFIGKIYFWRLVRELQMVYNHRSKVAEEEKREREMKTNS